MGQVLLPPVALLHSPGDALGHDLVELVVAKAQLALGAQARGDVDEHAVHEGPDLIDDVRSVQIGAQQTDAAIDVVTHPAGRHDPVGLPRGGHAAYREPVTEVDIWHGQGVSHDARERGHVRHLVKDVVPDDGPQHLLAGVEPAVGPHVRSGGPGDRPDHVALLLDDLFPIHDRTSQAGHQCLVR